MNDWSCWPRTRSLQTTPWCQTPRATPPTSITCGHRDGVESRGITGSPWAHDLTDIRFIDKLLDLCRRRTINTNLIIVILYLRLEWYHYTKTHTHKSNFCRALYRLIQPGRKWKFYQLMILIYGLKDGGFRSSRLSIPRKWRTLLANCHEIFH